MRNFLLLVFVLFFSVVAVDEASAFRFSPFRAKFSPSGDGSNQLFKVENNTNQPASVQIRITTRDIDVDGGEKNVDDEKDFMIYPAQLVLKPHQSRSVRVQWVGDPDLKEEKSYRIIAEQLPINLDRNQPKTSTVRFLVSYHGALFVTPPGLSSNVTLDFSGSTRDVTGKKFLEIVLHNRGKQHAMLRNLKLHIKDNKANAITLFGEEQLKGITGEGILAGHRRQFMIPWPKELTGTPTHIDFTFDKGAF
jgi:fimbrial chaperone protein